MKVVIFGANGKTGILLVEQALAKGYQVVAYIRRAGTIRIENPKLKIVVGNLNETLKMKDAITGADACISALGGGSLSKHATEVMVGIRNIVSIMEITKVHRFIYLSSLGANESGDMIAQPMRFILLKMLLRVTLADHNTNENIIKSSKLQWTLVRPGSLTDGMLTGEIKHGYEKIKIKGSPTISRANVASFMIQQLNDATYHQKGVWLFE
ncbi:MAG: NAD(P)H-binding protein [Paludibacter sp.]|nr:NAD(P)H-binding protein [Paludibacter sp.]